MKEMILALIEEAELSEYQWNALLILIKRFCENAKI